MLTKKSLEIPIVKGIDTKIDDKQLQIGKLLEAQNCEFRKPGKIQKRVGFTNLGNTVIDNGTTISNGQAIMNYKEELLAFDKEDIFSYVSGNDAWKDKGNFQSVYATSQPVSNGTARDYMPDSAYWSGPSGGLEAYVFMRESGTNRTMYYQVHDSTTKQIIVGPIPVSSDAFNPKVVLVDDTFVMYYYSMLDTRVYVGLLGTGNLTGTVTWTPISDSGGNINSLNPTEPVYIVKSLAIPGQGTNVYFAYNNDIGGFTVKRFASSNLLTPANSTGSLGGTLISGDFTWRLVGSRVYFLYTRLAAASVNIIGWAYDLTSSLASSTAIPTATSMGRITISLTSEVSGRIFAFVDYVVYNPSYGVSRYWTSGVEFPSLFGTVKFSVQQMTVGGGAFTYNGKSYCLGIGGVDLDPTIFLFTKVSTYFLLDEAGSVIGRYFNDIAGGINIEQVQGAIPPEYILNVPSTSVISGTEFLTAVRTTTQFGEIGGVAQTGIRSITQDFFEPQKSYAREEIADSLYIGGGMLYQYDGGSLVEDAFNFPPLIKYMEANNPGTAYSYQYVAVWEWVDNYGNVHRSAPSDPYTITTAAPIGSSPTDYVEKIWCMPLGVTLKTPANNRSPVICVLYRTKAGVEVFEKLPVTSANTNDVNAFYILPANDTVLDVNLGQDLYTTGQVENTAPPPIGAMTVYKNRLWALDSTDLLTIYYSQRVAQGVTVEWNDGLIINVDPTGGPVTGLAAMDDKLIIFKKNSIRYISGNGPNPDGTNDDFGGTTLITTDAGCDNTRSIVNTPEGLIFKSSKGVYFLNRGLQVSYIGAPVEAFNDEFVTSAVLMAQNNQVRLTLEGGTILVYDYYVEAWATFTQLDAVDSIIWKGKHTFITETGFVAVQGLNGDVYTDNGVSYPMLIMTSWIPFGGIQGYQRIYKMTLLGTFKSDHNLQCRLYYDYNNAYYQTITVDPQIPATYGTALYGAETPYGGEFDLYQYELRPERQKCMSIRMKIQDTPVDGVLTEGYDLSNIRFSFGVIGGNNRVRAAQVAG